MKVVIKVAAKVAAKVAVKVDVKVNFKVAAKVLQRCCKGAHYKRTLPLFNVCFCRGVGSAILPGE